MMKPTYNYYKITVWIKGRSKPLFGIRKYLAFTNLDVHSLVRTSLRKYYLEDEILRVEIELLTGMSVEIENYISRLNDRKLR